MKQSGQEEKRKLLGGGKRSNEYKVMLQQQYKPQHPRPQPQNQLI